MTRVLVVYESMFGNTREIAHAVAEGLSELGTANVTEVGAASRTIPGDVDLLVVGAPTHVFGLSRTSTRKSAADQADGEIVSRGIGMREFLAALPHQDRATTAAAFDTRVKIALMPGSAARAAAKRLHRLGFAECTGPASFYVAATPGPLNDGERARAVHWGQHLASEHLARQRA